MTARVQRDDEVMVIAGRDKGKRGKVQRVMPDKGKVMVEGVNMVKRHLRAGAEGARQAGIIDKEMPIHAADAGVSGVQQADAGGHQVARRRLQGAHV